MPSFFLHTANYLFPFSFTKCLSLLFDILPGFRYDHIGLSYICFLA
jgi:hypothetical protein